MNKPEITIFTGFHYDSDIPKTSLYCFINYYLPSLKAQTYKDFNIIILSNDNENNNNIIREYIDKSELENIKIVNINQRKLYQSEIEINIDNDDSVDRNFIDKIVEQYYLCKLDTFLVVFYYLKYDILNKQYYKPCIPIKENRGFPTPFYALVQRGEKKFNWGSKKHNEMDSIVDEVITIPDCYCIMNIHGNNISNKITDADQKI